MTFELHIFLWHITLGMLLVYLLISLVLYLISDKRLFLYYCLYLLLLGVYIFDKNEYNFTLEANTFTYNLNWYIQIIYHFIYFWFSFEFVRYFYHRHGHKKGFKFFTVGFLITGTLLFAYSSVVGNTEFYLNYFLFFHVPIVVLGFAFVLWNVLRIKEVMKWYYIPGFAFYLIFSLTALYFVFNPAEKAAAEPISYFYIAVIIETTMFSAGLGYYIKRTFDENLLYEKQLNAAQEESRNNLKSQLSLQELDNEVIRMKISSLQSRMNSHFIFNTLNSLKTFIVENEPATAVNFLNKYAKLMRIYLYGSQQKTQSVEDEIQAVQLYVEIENQRLNHQIDFNIYDESAYALSGYQIPVHVLIPFVEYSIWKGLFFKDSDKILNIKFKSNDHDLKIEIVDNGYYNGVKPMASIDEEILNGIEIAEKNIELYNAIASSQITLYTHYGTDGGKVEISIPQNV